MNATRRLIVNADDFGLSPGVNRGIIAAHEGGIVTSASLMVRGPVVAEAADYARAHPRLSVGLHVDLGEWAFRGGAWVELYRVVPVDDAAAVAAEVAHQLAAFRRLADCDPTHLDSHQHVHRNEPVRQVVMEVAAGLGVPLRHHTPGVVHCGDFYGQDGEGRPYPHFIRAAALIALLECLRPGVTELGCHPGEGDLPDTMYNSERRDEVRTLCNPGVRQALGALGIESISFRDLGRAPAADNRGARFDVKTLVAGWFSFEQMGASAGDLLARDVACAWLREAGHEVDVALAAPFSGGVDWRTANPADYAQVVFVCGPFGNGPPLTDFLRHFAGRPLIGLNLTMLEPLEAWNPFDLLIERDSSARANPDFAFLAPPPRPVVGLVLIDTQPEYGQRDRHEAANAALRRLAAARDVAIVPIDTRLDTVNQAGLRSAAQVEALIARMDCVLTTRLHGTVLALKNGVPALAVDPVAGGAKIRRQAETLGWPMVFAGDALDEQALAEAMDWCLTGEARRAAASCAERAAALLGRARYEFLAGLAGRGRRAAPAAGGD